MRKRAGGNPDNLPAFHHRRLLDPETADGGVVLVLELPALAGIEGKQQGYVTAFRFRIEESKRGAIEIFVGDAAAAPVVRRGSDRSQHRQVVADAAKHVLPEALFLLVLPQIDAPVGPAFSGHECGLADFPGRLCRHRACHEKQQQRYPG